MTTQLSDLAADEVFADSVGDVALAALLRTKPPDDGIPAAVWWLIAETLRTSVTIRRTLAAENSPDREDLPILVARGPVARRGRTWPSSPRRPARARPRCPWCRRRADAPSGGASGRRSGCSSACCCLARMLVSHRATTPQRLANTLAAHLRALSGFDELRAPGRPRVAGRGRSHPRAARGAARR